METNVILKTRDDLAWGYWREQPAQGEPSRCPTCGSENPYSYNYNCRKNADGWHRANWAKFVPAQPEGGEKPRYDSCTYACDPNRDIHTGLCYQRRFPDEPSSPPAPALGIIPCGTNSSAPAGGARKWLEQQLGETGLMNWTTERVEAYADQKVSQALDLADKWEAEYWKLQRSYAALRAGSVQVSTEVAQLRQERDALLAKLEALNGRPLR